jgi:RNA polymerase sigma factor (sigma-70 family)
MTAPADDCELLRAYQAGRVEAFEAIVRRHYAPLLRAAEQRCGAGLLAEDAVQAGLVRAHRYLLRTRGVENLGAWLRRVVLNCANDLLRDARRELPAPPAPAAASVSNVSDAIEAAELRTLVRDAISRLPAIYRDPLELCFLDGLESQEIAERLGENVNSVKSRIARGRRELRRRLEGVLRRAGWR